MQSQVAPDIAEPPSFPVRTGTPDTLEAQHTLRVGAALLTMVALLWLALVIVRNAWLSDDAFITFRIADNFTHGRGMTWNPGQRVQAFTHPAWFFLVSAAHLLTREIYYTALGLSLLVSCAGLWVACTRLAIRPWCAIPVLIGLIFSRTFVDYSTSGLENPLAHLLLFIWIALALRPAPVLSPWFDIVSGLIVLNRLDHALLVMPLWLWLWYERFRMRGVGRAATAPIVLAFGPLLAWLAFATFYFGFPLPNTAYAKLGPAIAWSERLGAGLLYMLELLAGDPLSVLMLGLGLGVAFAGRTRALRLAAVGALAYIAYFTWIGGDFMAGRFFSAPLVIAAAALLRVQTTTTTSLGLAAMLAVAGSFGPTPPALSGRHAEAIFAPGRTEHRYGTVDERRYYFASTGLLSMERGQPMPKGPLRRRGERLSKKPGAMIGGAGMRGFYAGYATPLVEKFGLTDPFLARLPHIVLPDWIMGHFERIIPVGYAESLRSGENQIRDPKLAAFYEEMTTITRGPLWSRRRLRSIVRLNTGALDPLFKPEASAGPL